MTLCVPDKNKIHNHLGKNMEVTHRDADYLRYKAEKQELINQIKILSSDPSTLAHLESKTITELMRIYYAGFSSQCARCGHDVQIMPFKSIYQSNAS